MTPIEYRVTWREFSGYKDGESKEILFQYPYSREPEQEAVTFAEQLAETETAGDIKITRRTVSPWMECIGV